MPSPAWQPGPALVLAVVLIGSVLGVWMRWWRRREVFSDEVQVTPEVLDFERRFAGRRRASRPEWERRLWRVWYRGEKQRLAETRR